MHMVADGWDGADGWAGGTAAADDAGGSGSWDGNGGGWSGDGDAAAGGSGGDSEYLRPRKACGKVAYLRNECCLNPKCVPWLFFVLVN